MFCTQVTRVLDFTCTFYNSRDLGGFGEFPIRGRSVYRFIQSRHIPYHLLPSLLCSLRSGTSLDVKAEAMSSQIQTISENQKGPKFLNVKELSELLRLKTRTIYDMVSQGRIPYRKAGDRTIFLLDEILEWTKPHNRDS